MRLLGLGALVHGLILLILYATTPFSPTVSTTLLLLLAIASLLAAGVLMEYLPRWSGRPAVHYLRYGSILLIGSTGLLWLELSLLFGNGTPVGAVIVLVIAWLLSLQTLRFHLFWLQAMYKQRARMAMLGFYAIGAALLLSGVGA